MISIKRFGEAFRPEGRKGLLYAIYGRVKDRASGRASFAAALIGMVLTVLITAPGSGYAAVAATKHNLSYVAPTSNAIKAYPQGTQVPVSEICVFCHTPHHSTSANPLWNKNMSSAFYNVYASQTMVTTLGQPTGASKLCLSCHDGTIALGEMLNLPGRINQSAVVGGTIDVTGTGVTAGKLTSASASYIGTELGDDHPISFLYSNTYPSNVEFNAPASFTPTSVKLDAGGQLQCTACHDPHGTANVYMLTADYQNGTLCLACHNKLQWTTNPSVHQSTTSTWNGAGTNPWREDAGAAGFTDDTPALQGCLTCHQMHGASVNKTLKRGTVPVAETGTAYEEWNCLNCHNGNMANANNINTTLGYTYRHNVKGYADKHVPNRSAAGVPARETATNLQTNRHAECVDCHNPHGAMAADANGTIKGNHTTNAVSGNYEFGPNLLGGWGVKPTGGWVAPALGNYSTVGAWTEVDFALPLTGVDNLEGYMCMKCHTNYSYPATPPTVPSAAWAKEWDVAEAMNPLNLSHHAVFGTGANQPAAGANANWPAPAPNNLDYTFTYGFWVQFTQQYETGAMLTSAPTGLWNIRSNSRITCTDCHASSSLADARGPHGSNNPYMLRGNEAFGTAYGGTTSAANFCYNCHRRDVYGDENVVGAYANYSRVTHPVTGLNTCPNTNSALCEPFYQSPNVANTIGGTLTGNASNTYGILCMSCHGGSQVTVGANTLIHGIHGSNAGPGLPSPAATGNMGARMLNGACIAGYVKALPATNLSIWFNGTGTAGSPVPPDNVCTFDFSPANTTTGNLANYNY